VSDVFAFGPAPERIPVTTEVVRGLVAEQFPQWSDRSVRPVDDGGWDNWTFHLGDDLSVRLPTASEYAFAVEKEHEWLPRLAAQLPFPVSVPVALGRPGTDYPFGWSIRRWIEGTPASTTAIADLDRFATDLARFLAALQRIDPSGGPHPGVHNWFRGGSLRTFEPFTTGALATLQHRIDVDLAWAIWSDAVDARWDGRVRWFHGDVAGGNLLLRDGHLAAVIDFGTCGVGDPACDLAVAWTLLDPPSRGCFRELLDVDEASWSRGRGWALWKALSTVANASDPGEPAAVAAQRALDQAFADFAGG
jgi:aminoglycoside phosphotransferase (APT) family kinase protein